MRIALAQLNPTSGDITGNTRQILDALEAIATRRGAAGHAGDGAARLLHRRPGRGHRLPRGQRARACRASPPPRAASPPSSASSTSTGGARNDSGTIRKYNAAAVVRDGRVLQRAHKSLLPNYRYFDDKRFFTPGERREPVDVPAGGGAVRLGVSICEDMWDAYYDVKPLPELAAQGAEHPAQHQRVAVLPRQAA